MSKFEVISKGNDNGVDVVLRYTTLRGTDIYAMGIPLAYDLGDDWSLGPTWCYAIRKDPVTLIDTGQLGRYDSIKALLEKAGIRLSEIKRVIVTHCHEDHDGNLPEIIEATGAAVWAHPVYESMISYHEGAGGGAARPDFPGSCRTCMMPADFNVACIPYHRKRSSIKNLHKIDINGGNDGDYRFIYTPGHSPDSLSIVFEEEVLFGGDTILPTITPHPSLGLEYYVQSGILPEQYRNSNKTYGLMIYINSLRKILRECGGVTTLLPGHRLVEKGEINELIPTKRAAGIISFHEERCGKILDIMGEQTMGIEEISAALFPPQLRKGLGRVMSQHEVMTHLELMAIHGDIEWTDGKNFKSRHTGTKNYQNFFIKGVNDDSSSSLYKS